MGPDANSRPLAWGHVVDDEPEVATPQRRDSKTLFNSVNDTLEELQSQSSRVQSFDVASYRDNQLELPHIQVQGTHEGPQTAGPQPGDRADSHHDGSRLDICRDVRSRTASESGVSDLSFASIVTVQDRGAEAHNDWQQSVLREQTTCILPRSLTAGPSVTNGRSPERNGSAHPELDPGRSQSHLSNLRHGSMTNSKSGVSRWVDQKIDVGTVGDEIRGAFLKSAFDDRFFLPLDELCDILCRHVVRELLHQTFSKEDAEELEFEILGRPTNGVPASPMRRRIFAILILVEKVEMIQDLVGKGIDDTDLPFVFESGKPTWRVQSSQPNKRESFTDWPMKLAHDFSSHQHEIHVPFFKFPGDNISFYPLESNSTLPFLTNNQCAISGYSIVHRVSIHKAHHNYSGQTGMQKPRQFAVKKLHLADAEAYQKEVHVFEKLGIEKTEPQSGENGQEGKLSNHLIPLLLAYSHGKDYYLMFPWADGNLKQFWQAKPANPNSYLEVRWFFNQCWGVARGLGKIHHLSTGPKVTIDASNAAELVLSPVAGEKEWGRHGDVKPENILWFANYDGHENHLVISDFGLTRFNSAFSRSNVLQEQIQGFSETYLPPDLHLDEMITQKYDVWSLGCVLLEFVSWFLLGYKQTIEDFSKARVADKLESPIVQQDKFFVLIEGEGKNKGKNGAQVKSSVIEWIKKLHSAPCCTEPLHSLLDLIQYTMLVPAAQDRLSCDMVRNELRDIFQQCKDDQAYALNPTSTGPDKERYTCLMDANRTRSLLKARGQRVSKASVRKPKNEDLADAAVVAVSAMRNCSGSLELEANETPVPHNHNSRARNDRTIQEPIVESQLKISRILAAETTRNTFSDGTSQDNGTTYTPHTDPCTTQQEMNRVGAQFDDDIDSTGVCKDITASINEMPESRSLIDVQNCGQQPQNNLPRDVSSDVSLLDNRSQ
ncbi:hypothetical protein FDECE_1203 [Fusarium decemcellulare]|nr:hypothetical protein FDECE_1203 [Fusarium decemcellulare]